MASYRHIFVDRHSVELFGNGGLVQITDQIFPASDSLGLELFAAGGPIRVNRLTINELRGRYHIAQIFA